MFAHYSLRAIILFLTFCGSESCLSDTAGCCRWSSLSLTGRRSFSCGSFLPARDFFVCFLILIAACHRSSHLVVALVVTVGSLSCAPAKGTRSSFSLVLAFCLSLGCVLCIRPVRKEDMVRTMLPAHVCDTREAGSVHRARLI